MLRLITHSFWFYLLAFFWIILTRYFLIAGGAHWLFYSVLRKSVSSRRLRLKPPLRQSMLRDIKLSSLSTVVFALGAAFVISMYDRGMTLLYSNPYQHGLWYLGFSFAAVLILQDAYFYFAHRIFHHPSLFKWFHRGHHRSGDPTPWTSFAFDLPEAIVQAFFLIGIVFILPLHFITLISVVMTMTIWTVWNHLGFELFPPSFPHHWFTKWFIGPTHHSLHHRKYTVHYGLYFTFWDKLLGTQDPQYGYEFDSALRRESA
ncbi:MAG: sterol desaturase family protein [Oscillatoriophycideae cyanobacterium NC_groundwater_1537_Pr4_S-0.65um_50_18]|nr:sterol desaturase family protein [Oscillatoriophycideae cyanobacterium NC_groundwater_1537_Pr4_S-0.65um_50_18]